MHAPHAAECEDMGIEDRGKSGDVDKKAPTIPDPAFHIFATTGWKKVGRK